MSEEKKLTDKLEEMYVSGKFNGEIIFNAIKTIYALQGKNAEQKAEIERLTLAVEGLTSENKVLHKENTNVISLNDALYREKAEHQKQIAELAIENEEYKRKIANGELMECIVIRPEDLGHNDPVGETGKSFIEQAVKDTAKKFSDLVEFHSIAHMNDGVECFTISALGLKEILVEEFGFKYSELNGVEVE